jgi:hypothetical protein
LGSSIRWKKLALFVKVFGAQNFSEINKMPFGKILRRKPNKQSKFFNDSEAK